MTQVTTAGFAFVEFVAETTDSLVPLFERLGFKPLRQSPRTGAVLMRQGEANVVINPAPNAFRDGHGTSVRAIGINVDHATNALTQAIGGGARRASPEEFELGGTVRLSVKDPSGASVDASLSAEYPDGSRAAVNGSFMPPHAGRYSVRASREGFLPAEANFSVKQHPLELSLAISGDRLLVNTTSRGRAAPNISLIVEKPSGREKAVTDRSGAASIRIKNDGRIRISANPDGENPDYGKISVVRNIVKMHDYSALITALSAVALVALIALAVVYAAPRMGSSGAGRPAAQKASPGMYGRRQAGHSSLSGHKKRTSSLARK